MTYVDDVLIFLEKELFEQIKIHSVIAQSGLIENDPRMFLLKELIYKRKLELEVTK